jgi:hypothetical protein
MEVEVLLTQTLEMVEQTPVAVAEEAIEQMVLQSALPLLVVKAVQGL